MAETIKELEKRWSECEVLIESITGTIITQPLAKIIYRLQKGGFIQKQNHPKLMPYYIFKDTDNQETVGVSFTLTEAKKLCVLNQANNHKQGYQSFIK